MHRFFNTAGPVDPAKHYALPPLSRLDLAGLEALIAQERYFLLHAPRQSGKTSALLALMDRLNAQARYRTLYVNIETAQTARNDVARGIDAVGQSIADAALIYLGDAGLEAAWREERRETEANRRLTSFLQKWSLADPAHPIVLLLDEVDALVGDTLVSLLRQLRAGYAQRPRAFPQTVLLCGVRDLRDYRIHCADGEILSGGSAFNIKAESLRLADFSRDDIATLYAQYTADTGHAIEAAAIDRVWELTRGQPWLVNALARQALEKARPDRTIAATLDDFETAKEHLILKRETHLDQLVFRLQEERVRRVIEPMLAGDDEGGMYRPDDLEYLIDLGLIRRESSGKIEVANGIYREVIPRELVWAVQSGITPPETPWYVRSDGSLDTNKLLAEFQDFYRRHSEHWLSHWDYKEAGPQLLLQAYLQRVVNGGGRIEREYGLGRRRTDLYLEWVLPQGGKQKVVIEIKLQRGERAAVLKEALPQVLDYADRCAASEAHLLIFDVRAGRPWEAKISRELNHSQGRAVVVWGI